MSCKPDSTHHNACDCREKHFRTSLRRLEIELAAAKAEILRLSGKTGFCAECEEKARLLGMSGSREAKLLAEIERLKSNVHSCNGNVIEALESENKRLRETIQRNEDKSVECERLRGFLVEAVSTAKSGYRAGAKSIDKWQSALNGGKA